MHINQLDLCGQWIGLRLRNTALEGVTNFVRPELVALGTAALLGLARAYDHCDVLLDNHLPKMLGRLRQRALTGDDLFVPVLLICLVEGEDVVNEATVDVL